MLHCGPWPCSNPCLCSALLRTLSKLIMPFLAALRLSFCVWWVCRLGSSVSGLITFNSSQGSSLSMETQAQLTSTMCPMCLDSRISTKVTFWSPTAPLRPSTCSSHAWFKRFTASSAATRRPKIARLGSWWNAPLWSLGAGGYGLQPPGDTPLANLAMGNIFFHFTGTKLLKITTK